MFKVRNKVYSEAGYVLLGENKKGYQFEGELSDFTEEAISLEDMQINGDFVIYGGILQYLGNDLTYEGQKRDMVRRRYSNDDQLAIILNNDPEQLAKMQEWRDWSSQVAHKIMEIVENHST